MFTLYRLFFENLRVLFPVLCLGGLVFIGNTCWNTCKMMGYDPAVLLGMI